MLKKMFAGLFLSLVLFSTVALAANEVWMPDPGPALGTEAEYNQTNTEDNGITYDIYTYDLECSVDAMSHFIVVYTEALRNMGLTPKKLSTDQMNAKNVVYYMAYTQEEHTAEMGVFVSSGSGEASEDAIVGWRVVLAVPEGMVFEIGKGAPGIVDGNTVCAGCGGSGKCMGCGGNRRVNYGNGKETCVVCDGNGICNVCDGTGSY